MREYREGAVIGVLTNVAELGDGWQGVVGTREVSNAIGVEYGLAEESIMMFEFKDGTFEVGIGESLRPYDQLYSGDDQLDATRAFLGAIHRCTFSCGRKS